MHNVFIKKNNHVVLLQMTQNVIFWIRNSWSHMFELWFQIMTFELTSMISELVTSVSLTKKKIHQMKILTAFDSSPNQTHLNQPIMIFRLTRDFIMRLVCSVVPGFSFPSVFSSSWIPGYLSVFLFVALVTHDLHLCLL